MKKNISINMMQLKGAIFTTREDGSRVLHFELDHTEFRGKTLPSKTPGAPPNVFLNLDVVDLANGPDRFGNDCFVAEVTSKEEREQGLKLYVGKGKTFGGDRATQQQDYVPAPAPKRQPRKASNWGAEFDEGCDDPEPPNPAQKQQQYTW